MDTQLVRSVVTRLLGLFALALVHDALASPSADEIMQKNLLATKVADSTTNSTFRLINASGRERVRETDGSTNPSGVTQYRRCHHWRLAFRFKTSRRPTARVSSVSDLIIPVKASIGRPRMRTPSIEPPISRSSGVIPAAHRLASSIAR